MIKVVVCAFCGNNIPLKNLKYCSRKCLSLSKQNRKEFVCSRVGCDNKFFRIFNQHVRFKNHYCSHRCNAMVVNSKRVLKPKNRCKLCDNFLKYGKTYCSPKCQYIGTTQSAKFLLDWIRKFYITNSRIPLKRECNHYHAVRTRFKSWNNAIIAAGYDPNPVMFAKKYIANDGHKCDSLSEKIIDDWMFRRNIKHKRSVPYPGHEQFTADFVVDKYWIEFFGLSGESKKYDFLKRKKIRIAKKLGLNLIKTYPRDLYPKGKLNEVLCILANEK